MPTAAQFSCDVPALKVRFALIASVVLKEIELFVPKVTVEDPRVMLLELVTASERKLATTRL